MLTIPELIREEARSSRLEESLGDALGRVPLYQEPAYAKLRRGPGLPAEDWLASLPFISKADLRRGFPENFLGAGADLDMMVEENLLEVERTSGTSEERTAVLLGRGWWLKQEEAALRQNRRVAALLDEFPEARRVTINSPVCGGDISYATIPTLLERTVGNNLFTSLSRFPFLWDEAELRRMAVEVQEWQPLFLDVDPVYGVLFAQFCERQGIRLPSLRFIICSYEFESVVHRRILERVFGLPVFNLYGSTETGHLLMESERGAMLPSAETAFLEVVEPDPAGVGELAVTTLTNQYMPLIRYRIGDLVERRGQRDRASYVVHGRARDAAFTQDGARVTTLQIDQCFTELPGFTHYQLIEQARGEWRLRFVADGKGPNPADVSELRQRLMEKLAGEHKLSIEQTDLLMPEASGKFLLGYPLR
jgi:phenylacetate-CoA ligase